MESDFEDNNNDKNVEVEKMSGVDDAEKAEGEAEDETKVEMMLEEDEEDSKEVAVEKKWILHDNYKSKLVTVLGLKVGLYLFDICSDLYNGADYVMGDRALVSNASVDNVTVAEYCSELKSYSHPIWGGVTIALTWLPGIIYLLGQGWFKHSQGLMTASMALGFAALSTVWPAFITFLLFTGIFSKVPEIKWHGEVWDYAHALAFKAQEGFLEAAPQVVLQVVLLTRGVELGWIQWFALGVSFVTLNLTSADWNYYWFDLHTDKSYFTHVLPRAVKVTPFFLLPILYKTASLALLVSYFEFFSVVPVAVLLFYYQRIMVKLEFKPQHITRGIFYNLCTVARPAAQSSWNGRMKAFFYREAVGSFVLHTIFLVTLSLAWDAGLLEASPCAFPWISDNVSYFCRAVIALGALTVAVEALYMNAFPEVVLPRMEKDDMDQVKGKLGWDAERIDHGLVDQTTVEADTNADHRQCAHGSERELVFKEAGALDYIVKLAKASPFFVMPTAFKASSLALMAYFLHPFSVATVVLLFGEIVFVAWKTGIEFHTWSCGLICNLVTVAKPTAQAPWKGKLKLFFRWEALLSFLLHSAFLAVLSVAWDRDLLDHNVCGLPWIRDNVSYICTCVMAFGAATVVVQELYLDLTPNTLLATIIVADRDHSACQEEKEELTKQKKKKRNYFKVLPFYLLPVLYKTGALYLMFYLLDFYAFVPVAVLVAALTCVVLRIGFKPHHLTCGILCNLVMVARPVNHASWHAHTKTFHRREALTSFLFHAVALAAMSSAADLDLLSVPECRRGWVSDNASCLCRLVLFAAAVSFAAQEWYLGALPDLVLPNRRKREMGEAEEQAGLLEAPQQQAQKEDEVRIKVDEDRDGTSSSGVGSADLTSDDQAVDPDASKQNG